MIYKGIVRLFLGYFSPISLIFFLFFCQLHEVMNFCFEQDADVRPNVSLSQFVSEMFDSLQ